LLNSSQEFFRIAQEIDSYHSGDIAELGSVAVFDRLKKTQLALNEEAQRSVLERFGIKGVQLDNIE